MRRVAAVALVIVVSAYVLLVVPAIRARSADPVVAAVGDIARGGEPNRP
jgi:hypothetical protein